MDTRGQNPILVIIAFLLAAIIVYYGIIPVVCWMFGSMTQGVSFC